MYESYDHYLDSVSHDWETEEDQIESHYESLNDAEKDESE